MEVTIFTPTYNRAKYLKRLYNSLLNQTNKNFKWIIVDDGSIDNTEQLVRNFISEKKLDIVYFKQKNKGKHIAHNKGVELCETELFLCVDSDDFLKKDAIDIILDTWKNKKDDKIYTGIVALRGYEDGRVMGNRMPKELNDSTLSDLYNIHRKKGETALIFKTSFLKSNFFPRFGEEKFLSEEVIYNKIDEIGNLIILDKVFYIMEYLDDGMTRNYISLWKKSPQGVIELLNSRYKRIQKIKGIRKQLLSAKSILVLNAFCIDRKISFSDVSPNKKLSAIMFIPSYIVWYLKFSKVNI